jgi:prepilin-type N-terminal cleavage/methylation domain-containing protein
MRRGLTIIETLAALALLSGLAVAGTAWMALSMRAAEDVGADVRWRAAANATLQLIHDDLRKGAVLGRPPVRVQADRLFIPTRHEGRPVEREYALDTSAGKLLITDRDVTGSLSRRVLLGDVTRLDLGLDRASGALLVRIHSKDSVQRRFLIP